MARVFAKALQLGTIAAFEVYPHQLHLPPKPRAALPAPHRAVPQLPSSPDKHPAFLPDRQPPVQPREGAWSVPGQIGSGDLRPSSRAGERSAGSRSYLCVLTICAFAP